MDTAELTQKLFSLQDEAYRKFHGSLLPGTDNIIGVRMPRLRALAKEILRADWKQLLDQLLPSEDTYYEESILQALIIAQAPMAPKQRIEYLRRFVPKISNWAVCDVFCSSMKEADKYPGLYWQAATAYFSSRRPYELRFASVMMLEHFTDSAHAAQALEFIAGIRHEDYYVRMGAAWAVSIFYIKQPQFVLPLLLQGRLDKFTHNKAIQKICESFRVPKEDKDMLRRLKRR